MATSDLKKAVARQAALGDSTSAIAERFGYSRRGMCKLLQSEEVQRLTDEERQKIEALTEELRGELVLCGRKAVENLREIIEDSGHPQSIAVSKWLLDKILPRDAATLAVAVQSQAVDPRLAEELARGLEVLEKQLGKGSVQDCEPYLHRGLEGIEPGED